MKGISIDESRTINTSLIAVSFFPPCQFRTYGRFPLAVDTGTSLIYVPDSVAYDFYAQVRDSSSTEGTDGEPPVQIPGSRKVTQFGPSMYPPRAPAPC